MKIGKIYCRDIHQNKFEAETSELTLAAHVYGLAIRDGKILISPQFDGYDFPGGTIEMGETHIEALIREVHEETGLNVRPLKLLNIYTSFFHHHKTGENYQTYLIYYLVDVVGGSISAKGFDEDEKSCARLARWVTPEELKTMKHKCSANVSDELLQILKTELSSKPR